MIRGSNKRSKLQPLLFEARRRLQVERKIAAMKICEECGVRCSSCTRNGQYAKCCLVTAKLLGEPGVTVAA